MKWHEIKNVPLGTPLVRLGSERKAKLLEIHEFSSTIKVRYENGEIEDRVKPEDFALDTYPPTT